MSHLSCCMEGNVLGIMEEPHVEDNHEEGAYLQVFVKSHYEEYFGQAHVGIQNGIEEFLDMGNMSKDIDPVDYSCSKITLIQYGTRFINLWF